MKYGILFTTVAVMLVTSAGIRGGWFFLLFWPALSFGIVGFGYLHFGPHVYGKSQSGILLPLNQLLLLPYLLYLWSLWYAVRLIKREPAIDELTDNIFIGRRLLSHELPNHINHVIDLTCEFTEPKALRAKSYYSFQILDASVPASAQLRDWAELAAQLSGNIYIHCAEGHGRTGLFAAALLLQRGHLRTPDEALQFIKSKRPLVRLGHRQMAALHEFHKTA